MWHLKPQRVPGHLIPHIHTGRYYNLNEVRGSQRSNYSPPTSLIKPLTNHCLLITHAAQPNGQSGSGRAACRRPHADRVLRACLSEHLKYICLLTVCRLARRGGDSSVRESENSGGRVSEVSLAIGTHSRKNENDLLHLHIVCRL